MNSIERFLATIERQPVGPSGLLAGVMPTPSEVPHLCEYFGVKNLDELKASCGDDFYAVDVPYQSPTCSALYAAFDWYLNGTNVDNEHRTLTAEGFFAGCETVEDAEKLNFPWPDPALYIDPAECRRLVDEAPKGKNHTRYGVGLSLSGLLRRLRYGERTHEHAGRTGTGALY